MLAAAAEWNVSHQNCPWHMTLLQGCTQESAPHPNATKEHRNPGTKPTGTASPGDPRQAISSCPRPRRQLGQGQVTGGQHKAPAPAPGTQRLIQPALQLQHLDLHAFVQLLVMLSWDSSLDQHSLAVPHHLWGQRQGSGTTPGTPRGDPGTPCPAGLPSQQWHQANRPWEKACMVTVRG